jgi:hypothetical protein
VDLENGPDAVRLTAPDGASDVLGYGALTDAAAFEGRPAPDVASGFALARLPDGVDTDDNAADWAAVSPPTPGAPNQPERDVAIARAALAAERCEPGDPVVAEATLANRGAFALAAGEADVRLWAAPLVAWIGPGEPPPPLRPDSLVAHAAVAELEAGDSVRVALSFVPPAPGPWALTVQANTLDDALPANDRLTRVVQVGAGELLVSEVCAAPDDGPEWIELVNGSPADVPLDGWTIEDAGGRRGRIAAGVAGGAFALAPESLVVVTSDPAALLALHPALAARQLVAAAPWPSLNNDPPSGEAVADRVVVRAPDGRACDALDLPGAVTGRTRERRSRTRPTREASNWSDSAVRGGTPGRANSVAGGPPGPGVALTVDPPWRARGSEPLLVTWRTGFERARITLAVYDVRGRRVRLLLDDPEAPGAAGLAWDGADDAGRAAPPGLYVLGLEARAAGAETRSRAWVSVE